MPTATLPAERQGPTYWFVKLDLALQDGDWSEAAEAAEALRALGIDIRLNLNRGTAGEREDDHAS